MLLKQPCFQAIVPKQYDQPRVKDEEDPGGPMGLPKEPHAIMSIAQENRGKRK